MPSGIRVRGSLESAHDVVTLGPAGSGPVAHEMKSINLLQDRLQVHARKTVVLRECYEGCGGAASGPMERVPGREDEEDDCGGGGEQKHTAEESLERQNRLAVLQILSKLDKHKRRKADHQCVEALLCVLWPDGRCAGVVVQRGVEGVGSRQVPEPLGHARVVQLGGESADLVASS